MFEILFPLAGSATDERALPHALAMAQLLRANVHLVRVLESRRADDRPTDPVDWHVKRLEAEAALAASAEYLRRGGVVAAEVLLEGDPTEHLVNYARKCEADMVLLLAGQHRGGIGVTGGELLWRSYLTTLLLRPWRSGNRDKEPVRYRRILVALDGSKRAECVLPWARLLSERHEAETILAHVVVEPELPRITPAGDEDRALVRRLVERNRVEATDYLEGAKARLSANAETRLLGGKVATTLHDLVDDEGVDLVVLSAHGYGGESRWPFGDVASSFVEYGRTPLLLVQDMPKGQTQSAQLTAERWGG